jgi:hypothetical protein
VATAQPDFGANGFRLSGASQQSSDADAGALERGLPVHRVYEIFEVMPDGSSLKGVVVSGLEFAKLALEELSKRTTNECLAADAETRQVVAQRNVPRAKGRSAKRVFQRVKGLWSRKSCVGLKSKVIVMVSGFQPCS